ncbi:MAG: CAP domain-containing protein [Caulobacteraceae bacterium]
MQRIKSLIPLIIIIILVGSIFGGCAYEPARRYIQTNPNNLAQPNAPAIPNNVVGMNSTNRISATYEVVDYSYITTTADSLNVRLGTGNNFPSIGTVRAGQKIRALGKADGWYIIKLPNSNRIGCIPAKYATAYNYGTQTGTAAPSATAPTATPAAAPKPAATGTTAMSSDESRILQLVNAEREKAGASPLKANGNLTKVARMKSQDMVANNYFSHQSPTYGSPFDMLKSNGISYMYAGENIAMNQTADAAFQAWMNSEGHRKNILNPNFTDLGVGIAPKGDGSSIYTQEFIGR